MVRIKAIMQQIKAAKADRIGENMDPGPIDIGAGYHDWVGRFRNKLRSTIGAADVPIIYVIRPAHDDDPEWQPDQTNTMEVDMYAMRLDGPEYRQDCQAVFTLLYNCCNHERGAGNREALAWIEPHIEAQDGGSLLAYRSVKMNPSISSVGIVIAKVTRLNTLRPWAHNL
jgi:hypothetical protein